MSDVDLMLVNHKTIDDKTEVVEVAQGLVMTPEVAEYVKQLEAKVIELTPKPVEHIKLSLYGDALPNYSTSDIGIIANSVTRWTKAS